MDAKLKSFQESPLSVTIDEDMCSAQEEEISDFNDGDSEIIESPMNLSPSSTIPTSCLGTSDSQPSGIFLHLGDGIKIRSAKPVTKRHRKSGNSAVSTRPLGRKVKKNTFC